MIEQRFPKGWDEKRVREVIDYYDSLTNEERLAEIDAAARSKRNETHRGAEEPGEQGAGGTDCSESRPPERAPAVGKRLVAPLTGPSREKSEP